MSVRTSLISFLTVLILLFPLSSTVFASELEQDTQPSAAFAAVLEENPHLEPYPELLEHIVRMKPFIESLGIQEASCRQAEFDELLSAEAGTCTRAPAPPLSLLEVLLVGSPDAALQGAADLGPGYEAVEQFQLLTDYDHGGAWIDIITAELGYGQVRIAKMAGSLISERGNEPIVSGGVIIGWYRFWDASGFSGGRFTYQSTSINFPFNTMSDWINIR